jgi:hypothetical protein
MSDSNYKIIAKDQYRVRSYKERIEDDKKPGDHRTELEKILSTTSLKKFTGNRLCTLTNKLIKELPFSESVIEITDTGFTAKEGGGRLVLRVGKTSKTFYPIVAIGRKRKTGKMLGKFTVNDTNHYINSGVNKEADITKARERFKKYIVFTNAHRSEKQKDGNMKIRFYLESGRYKEDRTKHKTKTGKYKPVTDNTIKMIISGFDRWMDCRLNEVNKEWALEFDNDCNELRTNKANGKKFKGLKSESKRKLFTAFSAMFNICETAGYIAKNELDGEISRFPKSEIGNAKTYNMSYESLMDHIFDEDTPETLTGKLIVAGMAVTAARNSELYRNYIDNFNFEERSVYIPAEISKNGMAGQRTVYPSSDIWWEKLAFHLKTIDRNDKGHMFPSPIIIGQHVSPSIYSKTWTSVKKRFNLKDTDRLYNLRSTLMTRIAKESGIDVAAKMGGDSLETADKYYNDKNEERLKEAMRKATGSNREEKQVIQINDDGAIVLASTEGMTDDVIKIFNIFKNGKVVPQENHLLKTDWDKFVTLIKTQKDAGKLVEGPILDMWLMVQ